MSALDNLPEEDLRRAHRLAYEAVAYMAGRIAANARSLAKLSESKNPRKNLPALIEFGAYPLMNSLGDLSDSVDMTTPEDELATKEAFTVLRKLFGDDEHSESDDDLDDEWEEIDE